ncbi:MAG: hypothetical protein IJI39_07135 [Clostridia bacterium]|nr:hypothetical protein [Clostridia bacterium]MBQ6530676.1 hypothetical protein [Clostridia bacterium]
MNNVIVPGIVAIILFIALVILYKKRERKKMVRDIILALFIEAIVTLVSNFNVLYTSLKTDVTSNIDVTSAPTTEVLASADDELPTFVPRVSNQFNYTIDCPSNFITEGSYEQETEDDFDLRSADRKATLRFTARIVGDELPYIYTIDYFRKTYSGIELYADNQLDEDGWYVASTKSADGFYHYRKCIYSGGIVRLFTFSFPIEQEEKYLSNYDYVSRIEQSFKKLY